MAHTHLHTGADLGNPSGYPLSCIVRYFWKHNVRAQLFIYSTNIYPAPTVCQALFRMLDNQE